MSQIISEYISQEHRKLLTVFAQFSERKKFGSIEGLHAFHELTNQFQEHVAREEAAIFPLLQKAIADHSAETDLLKKEHQAIFELVATILQKLEEGTYTGEEEEALHALLVNHMRNEESVLAVLDTHLNEQERKIAIENAEKFLRV